MARDNLSDRLECRADERSSESAGRGPNDDAADLTPEEEQELFSRAQEVEKGNYIGEAELFAWLDSHGGRCLASG